MNRNNIAGRLQQRFGLGENPTARSRFFRMLERIALEEGETAYHEIASCVVDSEGKKDPARWFCATVAKRLKALGVYERQAGFNFTSLADRGGAAM